MDNKELREQLSDFAGRMAAAVMTYGRTYEESKEAVGKELDKMVEYIESLKGPNLDQAEDDMDDNSDEVEREDINSTE